MCLSRHRLELGRGFCSRILEKTAVPACGCEKPSGPKSLQRAGGLVDHGGVPVSVAVRLGGFHKPLNLRLGEIFPGPTSIVAAGGTLPL